MEKVIPSSLLARIKAQPPEVIKKVTRCIPDEVLADPSVTVADLAMGGGDYLAAVLRLRLDAGVPREEAVKTLYGYESNIVYVNHALWKKDLQGANIAILKPSDLQNFNMKFDVIIGNPPYQDSNNAAKDQKLWMKFVNKMFELVKDNGYISLVTPPTVVGKTKNPSKNRERFTTDFSLEALDHTAGDFFNVGVDICQWLARHYDYKGSTVVVDSTGERRIDLSNELPVPNDKVQTQALAEKIYEAIKSGLIPSLPAELASKNQPEDSNGKYKTYMSGRNKYIMTAKPTADNGKWKIVFSYSATYKQWFVTQDNVCGSHRLVLVDTPEEGVALGETLLHPVVQFYLDTWRKTAGYTPAIKNKDCLPDIRGLTDEQIYSRLGITDDEKAIIETHYTEYKAIERIL